MGVQENQTPDRRSAIRATCGEAELLTGTSSYACGHRFSWILDWVFQRTGHHSPSLHPCPKCAINPTCLVCLERFDAKATDSCPSCDNFFDKAILADRCEKLKHMNIRVMEHKPTTFIKCRLRAERERLRVMYNEEHEPSPSMKRRVEAEKDRLGIMYEQALYNIAPRVIE
ncbi:hypothetical protein F5Y00DRAFT_270893 [Daldinia vernicosa]|uniref:uncharacterized protein n=1 Tax=Daldinia vernicosa TaxID=114800 RepID=UPI0020081A9D|nr:uncharacterized protein F5Y00DRAFT_270893 [Daldinia vernicosa]KAI0847758.1 hypothetical protein F5Y00DRAFT_270893 [Daldinia vernicosa]